MVIHEQISCLHSNHCVHSSVIKIKEKKIIFFLLQWPKNNFFVQYVWGRFPYFGTEFWYLAFTFFISTKTKTTVFKDLISCNLVDRFQTTSHPRTPTPKLLKFQSWNIPCLLNSLWRWICPWTDRPFHIKSNVTFQQEQWTGSEIIWY
jgi:hypothetical protein